MFDHQLKAIAGQGHARWYKPDLREPRALAHLLRASA